MPQTNKRRLKLSLEFDGTHFYGWQIQAKTQERTVQGELQNALAKLKGQHSSVKAAGRTDAGVHALAMVAHFDTNSPIPNEKFLLAINAHLAKDVRVIALEEVHSEFHAQYDCLYREYIYKIRIYRHDQSGSSLDRFRVLGVHRELDVGAMAEAAGLFEGKHDFSALATQETRSTLRTVYCCEIEHSGRDIQLRIAADGFLRNMVRATVGTLIDVGATKLVPSDIPVILASKDRNKAGQNVAPHGLYFYKASYEPWNS